MVSDFDVIFAVFNEDTGTAGTQGYTLVGPGQLRVDWLAHEAGHQFGIEDSYNESPELGADGATPGYYLFKHDVMSALNIWGDAHPLFVGVPPLIASSSLGFLNWIPESRIFSAGSVRSDVRDIELVALGHAAEKKGIVCVRYGDYYVEFRTKDGFDSGIPKACILVSYLRFNPRPYGPNAVAKSIPNNVGPTDYQWMPGMVLGPSELETNLKGGVRLTILSFDLTNHTAQLRIESRASPIPPLTAGVDIFGTIGTGAGGLIFVNGRWIRIGPRSPSLKILNHLALASQLEDTLVGEPLVTTASTVYKQIAGFANTAEQDLVKSLKRGSKGVLESEVGQEKTAFGCGKMEREY